MDARLEQWSASEEALHGFQRIAEAYKAQMAVIEAAMSEMRQRLSSAEPGPNNAGLQRRLAELEVDHMHARGSWELALDMLTMANARAA